MTFIEGFDRYLLEEAGMDSEQKRVKHMSEISCATFVAGKCAIVSSIIAAIMLFCGGCATGNSNLSLSFNFFGSMSRYCQALGGTNTNIKGQSEGGGSASATVPMAP